MVIYVLLIGHLIADFFLQSSKMADLKKKQFKSLFFHCIIYLVVFTLINFICLTPRYALISLSGIGLSHFVIDLIRCGFDRKFNKPKYNFTSLLIDQTLHGAVIFCIYYFLKLNEHVSTMVDKWSSYTGLKSIVLYIFLFAILMNPTSVFVKKLLSMLFSSDVPSTQKKKSKKEETTQNAQENQNIGGTIGVLERIITAILLLCDQYAAIGLVLTAKSIARFKQLEEKDFAEKYLIGTLTSLSISLIATLIVKKLI